MGPWNFLLDHFSPRDLQIFTWLIVTCIFWYFHSSLRHFPQDVPASQVIVVKNLPTNVGDVRDVSSIPGLGRSSEGGHGNPLQYTCLENPMNRRAWRVTLHRVWKSRIRLKRLSTQRLFSSDINIKIFSVWPLEVSTFYFFYFWPGYIQVLNIIVAYCRYNIVNRLKAF